MSDVILIGTVCVQITTIITFVFTMRKNAKKAVNEKRERDQKPINEINENIKKVQEDVKEIKVELLHLQSSQRVNEKDRLRESILNFGDKLRINKKETIYEINVHSFNNVFEAFDKYKSLGGNGFIDAEMNFIKKEFEEYHNE